MQRGEGKRRCCQLVKITQPNFIQPGGFHGAGWGEEAVDVVGIPEAVLIAEAASLPCPAAKADSGYLIPFPLFFFFCLAIQTTHSPSSCFLLLGCWTWAEGCLSHERWFRSVSSIHSFLLFSWLDDSIFSSLPCAVFHPESVRSIFILKVGERLGWWCWMWSFLVGRLPWPGQFS